MKVSLDRKHPRRDSRKSREESSSAINATWACLQMSRTSSGATTVQTATTQTAVGAHAAFLVLQEPPVQAATNDNNKTISCTKNHQYQTAIAMEGYATGQHFWEIQIEKSSNGNSGTYEMFVGVGEDKMTTKNSFVNAILSMT